MGRKTVRVLSSTTEEIKAINPDNLDLINDFMNYLETTDKSFETIKVYKNNLELFFVYLMKNAKNKDFVDIKKRDLMNFQNYLVKNGLSPARIRNVRASISSLSNFIESVLDEEEKWEDFRNIVNKIPAPISTPVREKTVLTDEDCQSLLDELVEAKQYQYACAFALAWASGRRKSELVRIKCSHIVDENIIYGSLYKTHEKIKTKGRSAKGKMLPVYIIKTKFKPYFDLWMNQREELGVPKDIDEIFITKSKGEWIPMQATSFTYWATLFSERLGVDFYFHCLRHNFTTELYRAGIPTSVIKDIVGWESENMVSVYTDIEVDDELGKYFGNEGIKQVDVKGLSNL